MRKTIPHGALVVVCDGRKALFLWNHGDDLNPDLRVAKVFDAGHQPRTSEMGADRPGRVRNAANGQRGAVSQTDWHELAELAFSHEIVHALERLEQEQKLDRLILVAPPRILAELRACLPDEIKDKVIAHYNKDLTKQTVFDIEEHLSA